MPRNISGLLTAAAKRKTTLARERGQYSIENLRTQWTDKELRREYSRLRSILKKRMERLEASEEFGFTRGKKDVLFDMERYKPLKEMSREELLIKMRDLAAAVESPYSTLTGRRDVMEKTLKTLHEHNYTFITEENYADFINWMDMLADVSKGRQYDSERVMDIIQKAESGEITARQMRREFINYIKSLPQVKQAAQIPKRGQRV